MKCMKQELLSILPPRVRSLLREPLIGQLQEIRMRLGQPVQLVSTGAVIPLDHRVSQEDLRFCVNSASAYSPWNAATIRQGYLTGPGGHRIGLCGVSAGETLRTITSLCIRIAKDLPEVGKGIPLTESTLILGPPGSGKTTLLRNLIRRISEQQPVSVVDERCELFPLSGGVSCFDPGPNTDVLSGKAKGEGIEDMLRSMGPEWIAVDEITAESDCAGLVRAGWCGVRMMATAHASSVDDLHHRGIYRPLVRSGLFRQVIVMHPDKSFRMERIGL